jgi:hypothetical protein
LPQPEQTSSPTRRGIFPIYKKEGRSFAALRGVRETEQFEAIQQSAAGYQAVRNL